MRSNPERGFRVYPVPESQVSLAPTLLQNPKLIPSPNPKWTPIPNPEPTPRPNPDWTPLQNPEISPHPRTRLWFKYLEVIVIHRHPPIIPTETKAEIPVLTARGIMRATTFAPDHILVLCAGAELSSRTELSSVFDCLYK